MARLLRSLADKIESGELDGRIEIHGCDLVDGGPTWEWRVQLRDPMPH